MGEMSHWYATSGELVSSIPMTTKEGNRPPTITDARKLGLLPSVTSILKLLDKPMLNQWRVEQAAKAAFKSPPLPDERQEDFVSTIILQSEEYTTYAADFGTAIHAGIQFYLRQTRFGEQKKWPATHMFAASIVEPFIDWLEGQGFACIKAEHSFASELGWGGTADLLGTYKSEPCIVDFKTQSFESAVAPYKGLGRPSFYEPDYPLQLAGYALGTGMVEALRISVVISREVPGLATMKIWEDNARWDATYLHLWELWKKIKDWKDINV